MKMAPCAALIVLTMVTITEGLCALVLSRQASHAFEQTTKALAIAQEWEDIAHRFEAVANTNLHTAQECLKGRAL